MLATPAHAQFIVFDLTKLCAERADRGAHARADHQQPDPSLPERGADAHQPGPQSREPAVLRRSSSFSRTSSAPSSFSPGAEHRLQRPADRPGCSSRNTATSRCRRPTGSSSPTRDRWQNTVGGLQDAMRVQAGVVGNIDTTAPRCRRWSARARRDRRACRPRRPATSSSPSSRSSSPTSSRSSRPTAARALTEASERPPPNRAANSAAAFLTPGSGYQPGNAQMFNNGN